MKRFLNFIFATVAIIVFSPLMIVIAILVYAEIKQPPIY